MVAPSSKGTPATVAGVPVKVLPTPADKKDIVVTAAGKVVEGNYPTFSKNTPRVTETVVKAAPGSITQAGGRTAFITEASYVDDGDTARFKDPSSPNKDLVCRLARVDAPETAKPAKDGRKAQAGQPFGEESKNRLKELILDKKVTVTVTQLKDTTGNRSVCEIEVNGDNINQKMLEEGMAWVYRTYGKFSKTSSADLVQEKMARVNKVGLFAQPDAERPFDYRRRQGSTEQSFLDALLD